MRITNVFSAKLSLSSMSLISENSPAKRVCVDGFKVASPDKDIKEDMKEDSMCWVCNTTGYLVSYCIPNQEGYRSRYYPIR